MGSFSIWHWLIVLVIVLLIFGTKKLRNMGADLGGAVKGFGRHDEAKKPGELASRPPPSTARSEKQKSDRAFPRGARVRPRMFDIEPSLRSASWPSW